MGANYNGSRPRDNGSGALSEGELPGCFLRPQNTNRFLQRRNLKRGAEVRGLEDGAEEGRGIHQLHSDSVSNRPTAKKQQSSQSAGIDLLDLGDIEYKKTNALELFDAVTKFIKRGAAHHATGAVYDRHILQEFEFEFELRLSVHTTRPFTIG